MSLKSRIEYLESDIKAKPIRIAAYSDFPFAIFRYNPEEEWLLRKEICLLKTRVEQDKKKVHLWSMADLVWKSLKKSEALEPIFEMERKRGFQMTQE